MPYHRHARAKAQERARAANVCNRKKTADALYRYHVPRRVGNPEDLLLASLAACHMLWYLHLASNAGIAVLAYSDDPVGTGEVLADGSDRFTGATLRPRIKVAAGADLARAAALHHEVHRYCFIARSVNFPIEYDPVIETST